MKSEFQWIGANHRYGPGLWPANCLQWPYIELAVTVTRKLSVPLHLSDSKRAAGQSSEQRWSILNSRCLCDHQTIVGDQRARNDLLLFLELFIFHFLTHLRIDIFWKKRRPLSLTGTIKIEMSKRIRRLCEKVDGRSIMRRFEWACWHAEKKIQQFDLPQSVQSLRVTNFELISRILRLTKMATHDFQRSAIPSDFPYKDVVMPIRFRLACQVLIVERFVTKKFGCETLLRRVVFEKNIAFIRQTCQLSSIASGRSHAVCDPDS